MAIDKKNNVLNEKMAIRIRVMKKALKIFMNSH